MSVLKLRRFLLWLWKELERRTGLSRQVYIGDRIDQYEHMWSRISIALNARFTHIDSDIWAIEKDGVILRLYQSRLELDNPVTLELAGRKLVIHEILAEQGIPVPDHVAFDLSSVEVAAGLLECWPRGIVVKPANGYAGKGVTTHVTSVRQLKSAAVLASLYDRQLVAERQIPGECYRILVYRGKVISVVRRSGIRITGDGKSSILMLARRKKTGLNFTRDRDVIFTLESQNLGPNSIPSAGESVLVRGSHRSEETHNEIRTVYDSDVTEIVSDDVLAMATKSAALINSDFLGVDVISTDISSSLHTGASVVNEINTTPALHHHYDSITDDFPVAAEYIIKDLLEPS